MQRRIPDPHVVIVGSGFRCAVRMRLRVPHLPAWRTANHGDGALSGAAITSVLRYVAARPHVTQNFHDVSISAPHAGQRLVRRFSPQCGQ